MENWCWKKKKKITKEKQEYLYLLEKKLQVTQAERKLSSFINEYRWLGYLSLLAVPFNLKEQDFNNRH